ncbi:MAG: hypothetical protein V2A66_09570 [Pseudomonadota bacterium]
MGRVDDGILTVRFTYRDNVIRIYDAGTGGKEKRLMKGIIKYADERMGKLEVIRDFLPPPEPRRSALGVARGHRIGSKIRTARRVG